jgi:23S rRNA (guanine2445-N2)-methyltransferase / 23S rRNA (guanine2069-N7)-methyltransferase
MNLVATAAFGLEAVVVRELESLGYEPRIVRPGRIGFTGDSTAIARANMWLRSADRVQVEMAAFEARDFDALFDTTRSLPWEEWIAGDAAILVRGRSHKSQLESVPACQRTVKKAIVERLLSARPGSSLPETGPTVTIDVSLVDNVATLDVDTSGAGLHRRGYRDLAAQAQLRETLAAAMVQLSFWRPGRPLIDPFCGTGTIAIEAATLGRRLAPGRQREFAGERLPAIDRRSWEKAREEAADLALPKLDERIVATDIDAQTLSLARRHAEQAGVAADVHFQQRPFSELSSSRQYGCVVTNPPYGLRMGTDAEIIELYRSFPVVLRRLPTWSHFILSAREEFEVLVGQQADRRRKLYNGQIACTLFQFYGPRPPKRRMADETPSVANTQDDVDRVSRPQLDDAAETDSGATHPARQTPSPKNPVRVQAFGGLRVEAARQAEEFANRLRKLARHLRRFPTRRGITCYRIYERDIPEVPLVVDRYEDALHIAEFARPHERTSAQHADWIDHMVRAAADALETPISSVFVKHRDRQRGAAQYDRVADRNEFRIIQEGGLRFRVNLSDYLDTGLFLDHRITRGMVRDESVGKRVLNLFAYTGSFTVYAAAGGASQTTTVDLSGNYLDWTAANLELNSFSGPQHELIRDDSLEYVASLPQKPLFDLAVIDPPTFSNSKRLDEDWDVQRDHIPLLRETLLRLTPGGVIYFSTNFRRFKFDGERLPDAAFIEISKHTIPEDFRNKRIHRCWRIVKSLQTSE